MLQPLANACYGTFVGIWRWMRSVKYPYLIKQEYRNPAASPLFDLSTKLNKQGLNLTPLNVRARWSREDQLDRSLAPSLHQKIVPLSGTVSSCRRVCLGTQLALGIGPGFGVGAQRRPLQAVVRPLAGDVHVRRRDTSGAARTNALAAASSSIHRPMAPYETGA